MSLDLWTLAIQLLNVAVLVWLLAHFFWRPVAGMIKDRRESVERTLEEAATAREQVEAERKEIAAVRAGIQEEREALLEEAKEAARKEAAEILAGARTRARSLQDEAAERLERQRRQAERAWSGQAADLAVELARKLLASGPGESGQGAFLEGLLAGLGRLTEGQRAPAAGVNRTVRVTGAAPLTTGEEAEVRGRIEETLGEGWAVEFATDPELINGFEAVGPAFTVRNSWRAILERARRDLGEVEHERPV